jgi:hypothetical protein
MATAIPAKGTEFWIEVGTTETNSLEITPVSISKANPAVVTCVGSTAITGEIVWCNNTGFPELDGFYFMVGSASTATSLVLIGANTLNSRGTLNTDPLTPPVIAVFVEGVDAVPLCVSTFSYDAGTSQSVSVATFCDPGATIPGAPTDGTATFAGFTAPHDKGYRALMDAAHRQDMRVIYIRVPPTAKDASLAIDTSGVIILEGTVNSYKETYEIGQAIAYTSGLSMTKASKQLWTVGTYPYVPPKSGAQSNFVVTGLPVPAIDETQNTEAA